MEIPRATQSTTIEMEEQNGRAPVGENSTPFDQILELYTTARSDFVRLAASKGITWEDGEDAVQETMLYLWRNAQNITAESPRGLLVTAVANRGHDRRNYESRRPTTHLEPYEEVPDHRDVFDLAIEHIEIEQAMTVVPQLSLAHRQVFVSDVQGLTLEEMASKYEIPVGTVKSRLSRARSNFRSRYEELCNLSERAVTAEVYAPDGSESGPQQ